MTDSIGGGGFRIARQPAHQTESTRVKPGSPRPQAEAGLNRFGEVGIRTGARVTRARTGGVEVKRFFTKLSLPFRSAAYKTERSLRHAEHRFDRHVNRMVEDLANKGAKLSDRALLGRLGAIAREAGRVTGLATAKGELSNPAAMRARFDTNLREALAGLGKKAPDKLAAVQARLGKLSDAQLGQVVSRAVGGMGTAEALRWGIVRGQQHTGPTSQMQTAQSLLGSLRNALNEAGGPGSARSTIDADGDMSSDEVQETPVYKPSGAKDGPGMLAWLSGAYSGTDEDSMSGWRDSHIGVSVEALVRERVEEQGVSVHVAVKDLNDAIKADKGLQPAFASKLLALTAAVREETILAGKLDQHDALSGIAEKDLWRLVAPAKGQADDDKWLADSVNQGSLAGMLRGFGHMIEAQEQGEPITADSLAELHGDMTAGTFKIGLDLGEDDMRFPQGLRDGAGTDLGLEGDGGAVTDAGRAELRDAAAKEPWFKLRDGDDGDVSLEFAPKSGEEVRARAELHPSQLREGEGRRHDAGGEAPGRRPRDPGPLPLPPLPGRQHPDRGVPDHEPAAARCGPRPGHPGRAAGRRRLLPAGVRGRDREGSGGV